MGSYAPAFNRILDDLAKRQLKLDFQFGTAAIQYDPLRSIGAGAFGIVAEATDALAPNELEATVAIKKIGHASSTPTLARRTLREVRVLRYIHHPNIVILKDVFRTDSGSPILGMNVFMVMGLMEGSLHNVIHGTMNSLEWDLIAHLLHQVLRGLRYIHKAGIAHRDLKPSNLLVNSDGHLRIADFGMAKLAMTENFDEADEHCFYMTQHIATLPYRAPELLFVMPEHGTAVDMWAVGCILAEMILHRELFPGRSVSNQIKIVINNLGTPSREMLAEIRCDRTRQFIQSFGTQTPLSWDQIIVTRDRDPNPDALDFISKLTTMEARARMDIDQAFEHTFLKTFFPTKFSDGVCPFKVKMDMAAVEDIDHKELISLIETDIRCADEKHPGPSDSPDAVKTSVNKIDPTETHRTPTSGATSVSFYSMSSSSRDSGSQPESLDPISSLFESDGHEYDNSNIIVTAL